MVAAGQLGAAMELSEVPREAPADLPDSEAEVAGVTLAAAAAAAAAAVVVVGAEAAGISRPGPLGSLKRLE